MIEKEVYDLSTEEGLNKFNEALDNISNTGKEIFDIFGLNSDSIIDYLRNLGQNLHEQINNEETQQEESKKEEPKFIRPSDSLTTDKKLQIHHIVEEYVNTMIKPFNKGVLTDNQINDAYAGLFEFACWIMNR